MISKEETFQKVKRLAVLSRKLRENGKLSKEDLGELRTLEAQLAKLNRIEFLIELVESERKIPT